MPEVVRHIEVEGGYNIRDLGGYPTSDGRVTQWRSLIRSGNLDQITTAGQQRLLDYGVKTVIDLRDDTEVREYPDVFARSDKVNYLHLPLSPGDFSKSVTYTHLGELYGVYLSVFQDHMGSVFTAIAESEAGILFHCAAGKDRTGMVSALLLGNVGVPAAVIADDYAQTSQHIAPLVAQWRAYAEQNGHDMQQFERDVAAEAANMLAALNTLETEYGGAARYLRRCGISDQQLARLQALLVAS